MTFFFVAVFFAVGLTFTGAFFTTFLRGAAFFFAGALRLGATLRLTAAFFFGAALRFAAGPFFFQLALATFIALPYGMPLALATALTCVIQAEGIVGCLRVV